MPRMNGRQVQRQLGWAALAALLALAGGGCVERTITITSTPPGSLLYLNDEEVGRTPVTVPFRFYGVYDVRLEHDGYKPLWTKHSAHQPVWDYMGPDLIAEAIPGVKSQQTWHFDMQPNPPDNPDLLIEHAREMRQATANDPDNPVPTTQPGGR